MLGEEISDCRVVLEWPEEELEAVCECPACKSGERELLYRGLTDRVFFCAPGRWNLVQCSACGSAYLDPRPTVETIHRAYKVYYTHVQKAKVGTKRPGLFRRVARTLSNGYRNERFGFDLQPASPAGAWVVRLVPGLRRRLDRELYFLGPCRPGARLLDVGFGAGGFLERSRGLGWKVAGVDPDPVVIENAGARGFQVKLGGIEAFADEPQGFDLITMNHSVEHVHDPQGTLAQAFDLLLPGGRLFVATPNIGSLGHEHFGRDWRGLEPPRHLTIFTWSALEGLLVTLGFDCIQRIYRPAVYRAMAAKSRAIRRGYSPYERKESSIVDRVRATLGSLRVRLNRSRSEYITLIAHKPS